MSKRAQERKARGRAGLREAADGRLLVRSATAYSYLLLPLLLLVVFLLYPTVMAGRMAFYEKFVYITSTGSGFGLSSFQYVLSDPVFWTAVRNTLILLLVALPITVLLALVCALLINSISKLQGFFQSVFFLPYVTSSIAIGSAFRWLFHSEYGYMTWFLNFLGIEAKAWLTDSNLVIWTLCVFCIWNGLAYKIVLFLAGLQKIDKEVYKAAKIDGASPLRTTLKITLPLLAPTTWMVSIMSMIYVAKTYNEVYALFTGYGGGGTAGNGNNAITIAIAYGIILLLDHACVAPLCFDHVQHGAHNIPYVVRLPRSVDLEHEVAGTELRGGDTRAQLHKPVGGRVVLDQSSF